MSGPARHIRETAEPTPHPRVSMPGQISAMRGARQALREATAGAHARLDRLYSCFDISQAPDYGRFLLAHAPAYVAVERGLAAAGAAELLTGWQNRLRADALLQDIADMGLAPPQAAVSPCFVSEAQLLGGLYVLEGSRLGGAVLIRKVAAGLPTAFLKPGNSEDWRALVSLLELRLTSESLLAGAVASAHAVFALFEQSAHALLEPTGLDL